MMVSKKASGRRKPDLRKLHTVTFRVDAPSPVRPGRREGAEFLALVLGPILLIWSVSRLPAPSASEERLDLVWEDAPPPAQEESRPEPPPPEPRIPPTARPDPAPAAEQAAPSAEPVPEVFGLPEEALSEAGDLAVAPGNTLMTSPDSVVQPVPAQLPPAPSIDLEGPYLESLRREVAAHYPARARKFGLEGTLRLGLVLHASGRIEKMVLIKGSGHDALDKGVLDRLDRLGGFAPFPPGLGRDRWELEIPVTFRLR